MGAPWGGGTTGQWARGTHLVLADVLSITLLRACPRTGLPGVAVPLTLRFLYCWFKEELEPSFTSTSSAFGNGNSLF